RRPISSMVRAPSSITASSSRSEVGWHRQTITEIDNAFQNQLRQGSVFSTPTPRISYTPAVKLLLLLLPVALVACKEPKAPPPPPPPDPLAVQLASPGAEPRRVLRYAIAKGTKVALELAIDAKLTMGNMGAPIPTEIVDLELVVDDVQPDGRMQVRSTI